MKEKHIPADGATIKGVTVTPGQSRSARQQYKQDVLVQAAHDALEELDGVLFGMGESVPRPARARSILETALKEVDEHDRD